MTMFLLGAGAAMLVILALGVAYWIWVLKHWR